MAKPDGGAAFPTLTRLAATGRSGKGMSLRDWFAGLAMQAELITSSSDATPAATDALVCAALANKQTVTERIAVNAYLMADAMLAERAK